MFGHQDDQDDNNQTNNNGANGTLPPPPNDVTPADANEPVLPPPHPPEPPHPHHDEHRDDHAKPDEELLMAGDEPVNSDLLGIKQEALKQLTPLVGHLDQTPEEKFKTTMMMIQASDDQSLIARAYEAAKEIGDEKVRAQALLDIVNEINYFTHANETEDKS